MVATLTVVVYGTSWSAASQMVRRNLDRLGVPYQYVDLEWNPARRMVELEDRVGAAEPGRGATAGRLRYVSA